MNTDIKTKISNRLQLAQKALKSCTLCPRNCKIDRTAGQTGYCSLTDTARVFREMLHPYEEAELSPSHQIYFAGCNLKCEFCTVAEYNQNPEDAPEMDIDYLLEKIKLRKTQGAKNINLLGGEPTLSITGLLTLLEKTYTDATTILNSNMYYNEIVNELLDGLIDIYLADFKCGNDKCAKKILDADNYFKTVSTNILHAYQNSDIILRHLVMPGHIDCCLKPILQWTAQNIPDVKLSLRVNYIPPAEAQNAPAQYITNEDTKNAMNMAKDLNLNMIK